MYFPQSKYHNLAVMFAIFFVDLYERKYCKLEEKCVNETELREMRERCVNETEHSEMESMCKWNRTQRNGANV